MRRTAELDAKPISNYDSASSRRVPRYTIDRFEGDDWAVLEDEAARTFTVPRHWLPATVQEGEVLEISLHTDAEAHILRVVVDAQGRDERLAEATRRRRRLPRGPRGDLSL